MAADLLLGFDGGGSSSRAAIARLDGTVIGEGRGGPASARLGAEAVFAAMSEAARGAWLAAGLGPYRFDRLAAAAGIAGFEREGAAEALAARPHPFAALAFTDDGTIACLGAHRGREGGIVIAGTGSIAIGLVAGERLRLGGYGLPASDEGSGARIGMAAMRLAFDAVDGRRLRGPLVAALLERFADRTPAMTAWCERAAPADWASLAPVVLAAAAAGDAEAEAILLEAGAALGALVLALADRGCARISVLGGLAEPLAPYLPADAAALVAPALGSATDGALRLAAEELSRKR